MNQRGAAVDGIAVIGMGGRFPGADGLDQFWANIKGGVESISVFSDEELRGAGVDPAMAKIPGFVNAGCVLNDIDLFDAEFFGFSPRDAETIDPQQRLFLECAWETLENAGYDADGYPGLIGVFGGSDQSTYLYQIYANPDRLATLDGGMIVDRQRQGLPDHPGVLQAQPAGAQRGRADGLLDVAGRRRARLSEPAGATRATWRWPAASPINVPQKQGYFYQPGGILSPDGHCRTFDAAGQGTVVGNGVGIVVLKRLADALADGDHDPRRDQAARRSTTTDR